VDVGPPLRLGDALTRLSRPLAARLVPAAHDPLLQLLGVSSLQSGGGALDGVFSAVLCEGLQHAPHAWPAQSFIRCPADPYAKRPHRNHRHECT
jgi:hypothetical protein